MHLHPRFGYPRANWFQLSFHFECQEPIYPDKRLELLNCSNCMTEKYCPNWIIWYKPGVDTFCFANGLTKLCYIYNWILLYWQNLNIWCKSKFIFIKIRIIFPGSNLHWNIMNNFPTATNNENEESNDSPTMQDLMSLLRDQSMMISSLQRTIEGLNGAISIISLYKPMSERNIC